MLTAWTISLLSQLVAVPFTPIGVTPLIPFVEAYAIDRDSSASPEEADGASEESADCDCGVGDGSEGADDESTTTLSEMTTQEAGGLASLPHSRATCSVESATVLAYVRDVFSLLSDADAIRRSIDTLGGQAVEPTDEGGFRFRLHEHRVIANPVGDGRWDAFFDDGEAQASLTRELPMCNCQRVSFWTAAETQSPTFTMHTA